MVDHYFTPERFRPALGRYVARYADGKAASADFYSAISEATGEPAIGDIFRDFVTQKGVPLVGAELTCGPRVPSLSLSQTRYTPLGAAIDPSARWNLPVCVSWLDGANTGKTCTLLSAASSVIELKGAMCPSVIVPNADGAGYYRFNLTPQGWRALGDGLADLPATEALASLDSAEAAFNAGVLDADSWRSLLRAALAHPDATVLSASLRAADALLNQLGTAHPEDLRTDIAAALEDRAGSGDAPEAEARILSFRALTLEDPAARGDLHRQLAPVLDGTGGMNSDLYRSALRVAFADGGAPVFEQILTARTRLDDAVFNQAVADAIGSVIDPDLARRAEALMFDGTFGAAASYSVANSLMANPLHRADTWARLTADFPDFLEVIPAQSRRNTPRLVRAFCDASYIPELDTLFAEYGAAAPGHEQALAETREYLTLCSVQADAARKAFSR